MGKLSLYGVDIESTSLYPEKGDIIEISILRVNDMEQKTWFCKPVRLDGIEETALKVNGAKLEDLLWQTKEGKEKYRVMEDVLPEIENFIGDDGFKVNDRVLFGHNISYDYNWMIDAWKRYDCIDSFPFSQYGRKIDTEGLALFFDWINEENNESYSLKNLIKKYGIEKKKLHTASDDIYMTYQLLMKFVDTVKGK